jgi:hypothetical protein
MRQLLQINWEKPQKNAVMAYNNICLNKFMRIMKTLGQE